MRSAKEAGCFPYTSKLVCFMELRPNGTLTQLNSKPEKLAAYFSAADGNSKIVAVWPDDGEVTCSSLMIWNRSANSKS